MPPNKHRRKRPQPTPDTAVKLTIPESCRMRGVFYGPCNIQIAFGKDADGVKLRFDRFSLEQFARLALELLAVPYVAKANSPDLPVRIVKPGPSHVPDITRGENSAFVVLLQQVKEQLGPYVQWLLHPDDAGTKPFSFADEFLLSMVTAALGEGMRELAYDRASEEELAAAAEAFEDETQD